MSKPRLVMLDEAAYYHVMGRMVRREFWFGEQEREVFVALMRRQAAFAGVEVLTYCMMGNHFHLLLRVPRSPLREHLAGQPSVDDPELVRRYADFYGNRVPRSSYPLAELKARLAAGGAVAEEARRRVLARMGDLSVFMQELKQRFMLWFNDHHDNEGTIWSARFKSVLVEGTREVLLKVANYIDLNPVRAGVVKDPADYRWSGYAGAVAGDPYAFAGLCALYGDDPKRCRTWSAQKELLDCYRLSLDQVGVQFGIAGTTSSAVHSAHPKPAPGKGVNTLKPPKVQSPSRRAGRFLSTGRALGSESFVKRVCSGADEPGEVRRRTYGMAVYSFSDLRLYFSGKGCRE